MRIICVGAGPAGLYFSILTKLRDPSAQVTVFERNPEGTTFGWGVTFSENVVDLLRKGDPVTAPQIKVGAASWNDQLILLGNRQPAHLGGYGFAIDRHRLLALLAHRATQLGVQINYEHPLDPKLVADEFTDADLVLAADGLNSQWRSHYADEFGSTIEQGRNKYIWLGTTKVFPEFTYAFEHTDAGWIWFYAYPCGASTTTFIAECAPETWQALGFDSLSAEEGIAVLEKIFARHLDGTPLLLQPNSNASPWTTFTWIANRTWQHGKVVLAGDAAHTAHFSIGNGTSLAIADAVELDRQLSVRGTEPAAIAAAVRGYEQDRRAVARGRQAVARRSASWFERLDDYVDLDPVRFSYALRNRGEANPPAPSAVPWALHKASQFATGRRARRAVSIVRRQSRARLRLPFQAG